MKALKRYKPTVVALIVSMIALFLSPTFPAGLVSFSLSVLGLFLAIVACILAASDSDRPVRGDKVKIIAFVAEEAIVRLPNGRLAGIRLELIPIRAAVRSVLICESSWKFTLGTGFE